VLTILFNSFRNGYRRSGREHTSSSEEEFEALVEAESMAADPARAIRNRSPSPMRWSPSERALAALPEEFRAALLLVDVQELSYQEVSESCRTGRYGKIASLTRTRDDACGSARVRARKGLKQS